MNFDFLRSHQDLAALYQYCHDAEALVLQFPTNSVVSMRNALEFIVKMIYSVCTGTSTIGMSIFDVTTSPVFENYVRDPVLLQTIHTLRIRGNDAAHGRTLKVDGAVDLLEQLHFLVGEFCILLGLETDYPEFEKPGENPVTTVQPVKKPPEVVPTVIVPPEIVAKYGPKMRYTHFDATYGRNEDDHSGKQDGLW